MRRVRAEMQNASRSGVSKGIGFMLKKIVCVGLIAAMLCTCALAEACFGDFTTQDLFGNLVTDSEFSNYDVTMVYVWATWCDYCQTEMPELEYVYRNMPGNANLVTFCYDGLDEMDTALEMAGSEPFKTLLITQDIYDRFLYQAYAFPTTFFVDCWGNMIGQPIVGVPSATDSAGVYLESINELLDEYA